MDVFRFLERLEALAPEFPSYSAPFLTADGGGVVVGVWVVDLEGSGRGVAHALEHLLECLRVHVCPEPVRDGVGLLDGLL